MRLDIGGFDLKHLVKALYRLVQLLHLHKDAAQAEVGL